MPMKRTGNRGQKALLSVQDVIKQKESGKAKPIENKGISSVWLKILIHMLGKIKCDQI